MGDLIFIWENLFKIDKIDGKGYGWIALQDIKP